MNHWLSLAVRNKTAEVDEKQNQQSHSSQHQHERQQQLEEK